MTYSAAQKLAAEALGAAMLVATVVGSGIMAQQLAGGNTGVALLANTLATSAMLFVLITTLGPVSGAHFNPVVSAVFALRREIGWGTVALYTVAQLAGGVGGTVLAHAMFDLPIVQLSHHARAGASQFLSESVATFALLFAILGTLRARAEAVPLAVALVIAAGYWFTASTSFANPAVTVARALSDTFAGIMPRDVPAFIAAQALGAVAAWLVAERVFGWTAPRGEVPSLSGTLEA